MIRSSWPKGSLKLLRSKDSDSNSKLLLVKMIEASEDTAMSLQASMVGLLRFSKKPTCVACGVMWKTGGKIEGAIVERVSMWISYDLLTSIWTLPCFLKCPGLHDVFDFGI